MLPIRTVLHPTDFSPRSEYAFHLACALARDYGARLILAHAKMPPVVVYGDMGAAPGEPEGYDAVLREKLDRIEPFDPKIPVERYFVQGDPAGEIVRLAKEHQCDLIVMGTHGRTGLSRLLMGSVAEQVLRKAHCPVLTVKSEHAETVLAVGTSETARGDLKFS
jgi:nucleotide-binding universal stress UspA family protein